MEIVDNENMRYFETRDENGSIAFVEYQISDRKVFLTGHEFPAGFEESGKSEEMIECILDIAKERSLRVVPMKAVFKQHFKKHTKRKKMLPAGFRV